MLFLASNANATLTDVTITNVTATSTGEDGYVVRCWFCVSVVGGGWGWRMGEVRVWVRVCAAPAEVWPWRECRLGTVHGMAGARRARCEHIALCCVPHRQLRHVRPPEGTRGRGAAVAERVCSRRLGSHLSMEGGG